jgi:hypothetical protein
LGENVRRVADTDPAARGLREIYVVDADRVVGDHPERRTRGVHHGGVDPVGEGAQDARGSGYPPEQLLPGHGSVRGRSGQEGLPLQPGEGDPRQTPRHHHLRERSAQSQVLLPK